MTPGTLAKEQNDQETVENFPHKILIAEFNYARETAAQAMEDRHKMVNFFLIIAGILINAIGVLLSLDKDNLPPKLEEYRMVGVGILLVMIFFIGLLYLLKLIRLRTAWFESALCMNQIKDYYDTHFKEAELKLKAFRWTKETLVRQDISKLTTLFGLSALLVIFIDSFAALGFLLLSSMKIYLAGLFFVLIIVLQVCYYKAALSEKRLPK